MRCSLIATLPQLYIAALGTLPHFSNILVFLNIWLACIHNTFKEFPGLSPLYLLSIRIESLSHGWKPILIYFLCDLNWWLVVNLFLLLLLGDQCQLVVVVCDYGWGSVGQCLSPVLLYNRLKLCLCDGGGWLVFAGRCRDCFQGLHPGIASEVAWAIRA